MDLTPVAVVRRAEAVSLMTQDEAAEYLRVTVAALQQWRRRGLGPPVYRLATGESAPIRYRLAEIDEWIESGAMLRAMEAGREQSAE